MAQFDEAFEEIEGLVQRFEAHRDQFIIAQYLEAEVGIAFLDGEIIAHDAQRNPG